MKKGWSFVPLWLLLLTLPASAASVEAVKGKVMINRGEGFHPAVSGAPTNAGDLVMASAGGSAKLVYPGGCQVKIIPGNVVSVGNKPPCTAPSLAGLDTPPPPAPVYSNPLLPFAATAAIGWGIFCAVEYCRDDDGGRRVSQPASP